MDKSVQITGKTVNMRFNEAVKKKIDIEAFPKKLLDDLMSASKNAGVSHEGLYHSLVSATNFGMLHSTVSVENTEWCEAVLIWNLVIQPSGTRKTMIHNFGQERLKNAVKIYEKKTGKKLPQIDFNEGSVEKMGMIMEGNFGMYNIYNYVYFQF